MRFGSSCRIMFTKLGKILDIFNFPEVYFGSLPYPLKYKRSEQHGRHNAITRPNNNRSDYHIKLLILLKFFTTLFRNRQKGSSMKTVKYTIASRANTSNASSNLSELPFSLFFNKAVNVTSKSGKIIKEYLSSIPNNTKPHHTRPIRSMRERIITFAFFIRH